jgi:uncharacterized protein
MKKLTFLELAKKIIEEEKCPLSAEQIWEIAKEKGYDKEVETTGKTPHKTIGVNISRNIDDKKDSHFVKKVDSRPVKFFLHSLSSEIDNLDSFEEEESKFPSPKISYLEKELHPLLAYFAYYFLKAYTKTINHSISGKKDYGEWIHPDMIGCYFPIGKWKSEVFELSSLLSGAAIKLFSFEIKRELSFANLRESFFQTVSNSSWANEAYLVASKISEDEDFLNELRRLSISFGIGVISLNISDPDSSEILFPARNREYIDWDMINKLTTLNDDFKNFLIRITKDIKSQEIRKELYDKILNTEKLVETLNP